MSEYTYSRVDLAKEQLEFGLALFLDHQSFASAITLAGAAEEIFGKELLRRGSQPALEWKFDHMKVSHKLLHRKELQPKVFIAEENCIRNALKHFGENDTTTLTANLEDAACWMLVRACENSKRLELEIARFSDFDNWFYEHVVGI
ncbi:MAG: hypothetical protein Q7T29_12315 [Gallionella sp.]|nr:hypothetical protein [Gallionella sp.]